MFPSGAEIKRRRQEQKLTQQGLADLADISRKYVVAIEKEKAANVSDKVMYAVCKALGFITNVTDPSIPIEVHIAKLRAGYETREMSITECVDLGEEFRKSIDVNGNDPSITGEYFLLMAQVYNAAKRYSEALRCSLVAADVFSKSGDRLSWAKAYFEGSNTTYERGQFATALDGFLVIVDRLGDDYRVDPFMAKVFTSVALCAAAVNNVDLMREYIDLSASVIDYVPEVRRDVFRAINAYLLGDSCFRSGAYRDAMSAFTKAFHYYSDINDSRNALRMRHNISEALYMSGDLGGAKELALEVLELKKDAKESGTILAETFILLGNIAVAEMDLAQAAHYADAVGILADVDVIRQALALRIRARICYHSGNAAQANMFFTEALNVLEHKSHIPLALEIMREYMRINHIPEPKVFRR